MMKQSLLLVVAALAVASAVPGVLQPLSSVEAPRHTHGHEYDILSRWDDTEQDMFDFDITKEQFDSFMQISSTVSEGEGESEGESEGEAKAEAEGEGEAKAEGEGEAKAEGEAEAEAEGEAEAESKEAPGFILGQPENPRKWELDLKKYTELFKDDGAESDEGGLMKCEKCFEPKNLMEANSVRVSIPTPHGNLEYIAPSHTIVDSEDKIVVLPYHDGFHIEYDSSGQEKDSTPIDCKDVDGNDCNAHVDEALSQYFPPGIVGYEIKHHQPPHRELKMSPGNADSMKERIKLEDTHIGIVVGIEKREDFGAVEVLTLNNPQMYQYGRFGSEVYPMIFVKPKFPGYLDPEIAMHFNDAIRTYSVALNAVSRFPYGKYNGDDPLAVNSPEAVKEIAGQMVKCVNGDSEAEKFFDNWDNRLYCAELAFVATTCAIQLPLNKATYVDGGIVSEEEWTKFEKHIADFNEGKKNRIAKNGNSLVKGIKIGTSPDDLKAMESYNPKFKEGTALRMAWPMYRFSDVIAPFIKVYFPRKEKGEQMMSAVQAGILKSMKPTLWKTLGIDKFPAPVQQAMEGLWQALMKVIGTAHESYDAFLAALAPVLAQIRGALGPQPGDKSGKTLFVPPHMFHSVAQHFLSAYEPEGSLGLEYVAHGFHWNMMRRGKEEVAEDKDDKDDSDSSNVKVIIPDSDADAQSQQELDLVGRGVTTPSNVEGTSTVADADADADADGE